MINSKNKKGAAALILFGIFAAAFFGGIILLDSMGVVDLGLASIVGFQQVYEKNYGVIECVKNDAYDYKLSRWLDQQKSFKCDVYTDECEAFIEASPSGYLNPVDGTYQINNGAKIRYGDQDRVIFPAGSTLTFNPAIFTSDNTKVTIQAKTFYIRGQENGKVYTQESCVLDNELRGKVTTDGLNELSFTGANKFQNYFIDFVAVASKTYSDNGNEVICQARQLYDVDSLQFKDGSTKKVQGEQIRSVECCPGENNCNDETFTFQSGEVRECQISSECSNGGDPYGVGQTTAGQYSCVAGSCQYSEFKVDCTSTAVCVANHGEGYVCDLSNNNYGKCIPSTEPLYCGDGICSVGESKSTCNQDCRLECGVDQKLLTIEKKVGALCFFGIGLCDTQVTSECVDREAPNYILWIVLSLIVLVAIIKWKEIRAGIRAVFKF